MSAIRFSETAERLFALSGPTAVSAGAGSGKTTCLIELCVRLFSGEALGVPCHPSEVAAITFTEKAALELEERLREALLVRARGDGGRGWKLLLHGLERMAIGTIHGFAGRLLQKFALEAGLDPDFEVADEERSQVWLREAARGAVVAAIDAGRPETLLLAAAYGTGGRRSGLGDLVADIVRERRTLGETAPICAAQDSPGEVLVARASSLAAARALIALRSEIRTATGARALEELARAVARLEEVDREGPVRAEALARYRELALSVRGWRVGGSDGARALKEQLVSACEAFSSGAAEMLAGPQKRELCALIADAEVRYEARKREEGALDFDDLLVRARDLIRDNVDLRGELRDSLRALLVDEYQDVNALQQEIVELLTGEEGGARGPVLVAVGDLKQSIYRFRGADVAVFRGLIERFAKSPPARVLHLVENHRSLPAVLELVNEVFSRCMDAPADARPYELAFAASDRLVAVRRGGGFPACEILEDGEEGSAAERRSREARAIGARIQALVSGRAGVELRAEGEGAGRCPRHADIAVLFRRLTQLGEYERALREEGIPYRLARGGGFYQAPEVRDLGELLASLSEPEDEIAWAALLRSPWCGVSDGALFALSRLGLSTLARRTPEHVVAELVRACPSAQEPWPELKMGGAEALPASTEAERLGRFLSEWHSLRGLVGRIELPALLSRAVERLDLEAAHLAATDGERRAMNLRKALCLAERFHGEGGPACAFARRLRRMANEPGREPEAELEAGDAVALLSVHQAKGLEWPVVFVADMGALPPCDVRRAVRDPAGALAVAFFEPGSDVHHATGALEQARAEGRRATAAESRRLLYVALTRARDRLVLSGEGSRSSGSWRDLVEKGLAARPDLALRIPLVKAGTFSVGPGPETRGARREHCASPAGPLSLATPPGEGATRVSVTELAEFARCPRRVFFSRHLRLAEPGPGGGAPNDDPDRATARGTLAHAMIAEVDLCAPPLELRAQLGAVATRRGYDPDSRAVRRIIAEVSCFIDSAAGKELSRAGRKGALRREVPFLLKLGAEGVPACYLGGALDALVDDGRSLAVLDFKYAHARPGAGERYRFQLLAYVLAAMRALPGRKVTSRLQFLRGRCGSIDVTPSETELRSFAREAPRLAWAAKAGTEFLRPPAELGRSEERCRLERCGYLARCYGTGTARVRTKPPPGFIPGEV